MDAAADVRGGAMAVVRRSLLPHTRRRRAPPRPRAKPGAKHRRVSAARALRAVHALVQLELLSYQRPHVLRVGERFEEGQQLQKLRVRVVVEPRDDRDAVLELEAEGLKRSELGVSSKRRSWRTTRWVRMPGMREGVQGRAVCERCERTGSPSLRRSSRAPAARCGRWQSGCGW